LGAVACSLSRARLASGLFALLLLAASTALIEAAGSPPRIGPDRFAATAAPQTFAAKRAGPSSATVPASVRRRAGNSYGKLPLSFVPNRGQTDSRVSYYAEGAGFSFYFTKDKVVLAFAKGKRQQVLDLRFLGSNANTRVVASNRREGTVNYIQDSDRSRWKTGLPTYGEIVYRDLWPGIDMVFRGKAGRLVYEFAVGPGARVSDIRLAYTGAEGLSLSQAGDLRVETALGRLTDERPRSYQRIGGRRVALPSRFRLNGAASNSFGFSVTHRDARYPVVIDPSLIYSTYLGGSEGIGTGIAVDSAGSAYVTGRPGVSFPTTPGAYNTSRRNMFVTKLNPSGSDLVYSTFLGGTGDCFGETNGIAVDGTGSAYVIGNTSCSNYPTTPGAFQPTFVGVYGTANPAYDVFVTKLDPSGSSLAYSTFLAGTSTDHGNAIAVDGAGSAYASGFTLSSDFPTTSGAFQTSRSGPQDAFVSKLNASGSALVYSTLLGGSGPDHGNGVAVDSTGNAYVTGFTGSGNFPTTPGAYDPTVNANSDAFVTKLNASGSGLVYSTALGGFGYEQGNGIALDGSESAYVTGYTESGDFPVTPGAPQTSLNGPRDAFVTKLNASGSSLGYSTYLGGSQGAPFQGGNDEGRGIAVDGSGNASVAGFTSSSDFPTTDGAAQRVFSQHGAFVTRLNVTGSEFAYSTLLGGPSEGDAVAVDSTGLVYVTGGGLNVPTTPGAFQTTASGYAAFVTKLSAAKYYPYPQGASPLRVSLVPAFTPCETSSADSQHGSPLAFSSCSSTSVRSSTVTVGPSSLGFVRMVVCPANAAAAFCNPSGMPRPDVRFTASIKDVRCQGAIPTGCVAAGDYNPNGAPGPYTDTGDGQSAASPPCFPSATSSSDCVASADLTAVAELPGAAVGGVGTQFEGRGLRITDRFNGASALDSATVTDIGFPVPLDCIPTPDPGLGSSCGANTTANAIVPGVVRNGDSAVWQLGQVELKDSGPDGTRGNGDDEVFAVQGVFAP